MSEDLSRRSVLSLIGAAFGLALALSTDESDAETAGTERSQRRRAGRRHPTTQSAATPAGTSAPSAPSDFKPTSSATQYEMAPQGDPKKYYQTDK